MVGLGAYIRQCRKERDLSLRAFSKHLGLSPSFISDIELGHRHPSDEVLGDMARVLRVDIDTLRAEDDRAPIEDIKRLTESDPRFAIALRTIIDRKMTGERLLTMLEGKKKPRKRAH